MAVPQARATVPQAVMSSEVASTRDSTSPRLPAMAQTPKRALVKMEARVTQRATRRTVSKRSAAAGAAEGEGSGPVMCLTACPSGGPSARWLCPAARGILG